MINKITKICVLVLDILFINNLIAQKDASPKTDNIVGYVLDKNALTPILDAQVELLNFSPPRTSLVQDSSGKFNLKNVPVGRHRLIVYAENYKDLIINDVVVVSGKENNLTIYLEENVRDKKETNAKPKTESIQEQALKSWTSNNINTLSNAGAVPYTLDEVNRFSGSRNDPSRLIAGAGGTINPDDQRNDIIAFGANPLGVQYRVNGLPVVNPNHLGYMSTPSGFLPVINTNCVANSTFLQGNFSAEYGNSTAGVFDINMRSGNKNRYEFMAGFSFNGLEMMAEGPLSKRKKSSFLIAGRYGLLGLIAKIPFTDIASGAIPNFSDLNFKLDFGRMGKHELFLFGYYGNASVLTLNSQPQSVKYKVGYNFHSQTNRGAIGLQHLYFVSPKTYIQSTLGSSQASQDAYYDHVATDTTQQNYRETDYLMYNGNYTLATSVNTKFSRSYNQRIGFLVDNQYSLLKEYYNDNQLPIQQLYNTKKLTTILEAFYQGQYRWNNKFTLQGGLHFLYYTLNRNVAVEPRLTFTYDVNKQHRLALGYALQHQQLPQRIAFYRNPQYNPALAQYTYNQLAQKLPLWGNHYAQLEYTFRLSEFWQFKATSLYRYWFNIPVQADTSSSYSLYNSYSNLADNALSGNFVSKGKAVNYGLDLGIQKSFSKGFYLQYNISYFRALYTGSDGQWYNALFDRKIITRLRTGQEFKIGKSRNNLFFISSTLTFAGGQRYTPIDLQASVAAHQTIYTNQTNQYNMPAYIRWDVKIGFQINVKHRKMSHYFYIDAMNLLNQKNPLLYVYKTDNQQIVPFNQQGFLPDILYRFQF